MNNKSIVFFFLLVFFSLSLNANSQDVTSIIMKNNQNKSEVMMQDVTIYTTKYCPYCIRAKQLLKNKGLEFSEIAVDGNPALRQEMTRKAKRTSVPQIWIGQQHVGGCDELYALERSGQLDTLLKK
jgi:glutaredoxin 3